MSTILITSEIVNDIKLKIRANDQSAFKFIQDLYNNHNKASDYSCIVQLGIAYAKILGSFKSNHAKGLEVLLKVKKDVKIPENDYSTLGELFFFIGICSQYVGNVVDAFVNYKESISFYENIEFIEANDELNIANALTNIAGLHQLNDYEEYNKSEIKRAFNIYKKHNANFAIPNCYILFASYSMQHKNFKETEMYTRKALSMYTDQQNEVGIAMTFGNLGLLYAEMGDFVKAFSYLHKSQQKLKTLNNDFLFANLNSIYAEVYRLKKDLKKAITYYREALTYYEENGNKNFLQTIYKGLTEVYVGTNQYKKAFLYQQRYLEIKQSSFKLSTLNAIFNHESKSKEKVQ